MSPVFETIMKSKAYRMQAILLMVKHYFSSNVNGCKNEKVCKSLFLPVILFCNNVIKWPSWYVFGDVNSFKTGKLLYSILVSSAVLSAWFLSIVWRKKKKDM